MKKTTKLLASAMLVSVMVPSLAFAHGNKEGRNEDNRDRGVHLGAVMKGWVDWRRGNAEKYREMMNMRVKSGTVSAVGTNTFDLKMNNGTVYTVNTTNATITRPFSDTALVTSDIRVNDSAWVMGTISGATIAAKRITITPQNTHPAIAKGTVTAVSGNTVTIESQNRGVEYTVTVNTNANTSVQTHTGTSTATSTVSSIQVGDKVTAKGLWDEVLNILNAIKIKILK